LNVLLVLSKESFCLRSFVDSQGGSKSHTYDEKMEGDEENIMMTAISNYICNDDGGGYDDDGMYV